MVSLATGSVCPFMPSIVDIVARLRVLNIIGDKRAYPDSIYVVYCMSVWCLKYVVLALGMLCFGMVKSGRTNKPSSPVDAVQQLSSDARLSGSARQNAAKLSLWGSLRRDLDSRAMTTTTFRWLDAIIVTFMNASILLRSAAVVLAKQL